MSFELANVIEYAGGTFIATRKKFSSQPTNNWRWVTLQLSFISLFSGCWKTDENLVGQLLVILQIGCEHLSNRFPLIPGLFFCTIYQICTFPSNMLLTTVHIDTTTSAPEKRVLLALPGFNSSASEKLGAPSLYLVSIALVRLGNCLLRQNKNPALVLRSIN